MKKNYYQANKEKRRKELIEILVDLRNLDGKILNEIDGLIATLDAVYEIDEFNEMFTTTNNIREDLAHIIEKVCRMI